MEKFIASRIIGNCKYEVNSFKSMNHAIIDCYLQAIEDNNYQIPVIRQKWFQIWRPKKLTTLQLHLKDRIDNPSGFVALSDD